MHKILILLLTALAVGAVLIFANLPQESISPLRPLVGTEQLPAEPLKETLPTPTFIPSPPQPASKPQPKPVPALAPAPALVIFTPPPLPESLDASQVTPSVESDVIRSETSGEQSAKQTVLAEPVPTPEPLNEEEITQSVVRIRCGKSYGSGFIREINGKKYAFTAAHVVNDKITAKDYSCNVIFPRKNPIHGFYEEAHYRAGKILSPSETETNFKVRGLDFAILEVLPLEDLSEDQRTFPAGYPIITYSFCPTNTLNDEIILWGYAANVSSTGITFGNILSRFEGRIVNYANATGVEENFLPKLDYVRDISVLHPYTLIVSENNFAGASGGLVFDTTKRCIIGNNIATTFDQGMVFGLIINPNYEQLQKFIELAL